MTLTYEQNRTKTIELDRLKEKVLCAEITFPQKMQKELGITGFTMKASEVLDFVESEFDNGDGYPVTFTVKYMMRSNRWIESLPEADI